MLLRPDRLNFRVRALCAVALWAALEGLLSQLPSQLRWEAETSDAELHLGDWHRSSAQQVAVDVAGLPGQQHRN